MLKKEFAAFAAAVRELQQISESLTQSIARKVVGSPALLREIWIDNQSYWNVGREEALSDWEDDGGNRYSTSGGLAFTWEEHGDGWTFTLYHPIGWHPRSRLLASAWLAGWRGNLDFEYASADAEAIKKEEDLSEEMGVSPLSVNLQGAHLNGANLRYANLRGVNLRYAVLTKADLREANLKGAKLRYASLAGAKFNTETILPDGEHWTPETDMSRFTDSK